MSITDPLFGLFGFIVAYFIGRVISERALKRLNAEEKAKLLDAFAGYRTYSMVLVLCMVFIFIAGDRYLPHLRSTLSPIFMVLLTVALVTLSVLSYRKLKGLNMPADYIRSFLRSTCIQYIGIALLFAPAVTRYFS
jgi:hypothetical protein